MHLVPAVKGRCSGVGRLITGPHRDRGRHDFALLYIAVLGTDLANPAHRALHGEGVNRVFTLRGTAIHVAT